MHPRVVNVEQAFLLVVDLQETYRQALWEWDRTIERSTAMIRAAHLLDLPIFYTEQYPKGLGPTTNAVLEALGEAPCFEKRTMSAIGAPGLSDAIQDLSRSQAIVIGIETHACINQTSHELLSSGFTVHLPIDTLSSRRQVDHELGVQKLLASGAIGGSTESIVFECLRGADHPQFKAVQALFK